MPSRSARKDARQKSSRVFAPILTALQKTNRAVAAAYPGERGERQPVHTVYGGAHLFKSDSASRIGKLALAALNEYAPDAATLGQALALGSEDRLAAVIRERVVA